MIDSFNLSPIQHTLQMNYYFLQNWLRTNKKLFRWVEPKVGAVCFPQIKDSEQYDLINFMIHCTLDTKP